MFTGIIETIGTITAIEKKDGNIHLTLSAAFTDALKIDQSVAHNGICLTVVAIHNDTYTVTAIAETIEKTNIASYQIGQSINLERAMIMGTRLDGHIVQGHVDTVATCVMIKEMNGSVQFTFSYPNAFKALVIEKGSICVNGISLTAFDCVDNLFTVAIIPYTLQHTNLKTLQINDRVNIEFDIIGKYILRQQHVANN